MKLIQKNNKKRSIQYHNLIIICVYKYAYFFIFYTNFRRMILSRENITRIKNNLFQCLSFNIA